jgi:hypothetical protein
MLCKLSFFIGCHVCGAAFCCCRTLRFRDKGAALTHRTVSRHAEEKPHVEGMGTSFCCRPKTFKGKGVAVTHRKVGRRAGEEARTRICGARNWSRSAGQEEVRASKGALGSQ